MKTLILYRPVNQAELTLIEKLDWNAFPPRLTEQPIFYPVMNEAYAIEITKQWNVPAYGAGFVVKWEMDLQYVSRFEIQNVGGHHHNELWVPAEDLEEFCDNIIGKIELIGSYYLFD